MSDKDHIIVGKIPSDTIVTDEFITKLWDEHMANQLEKDLTIKEFVIPTEIPKLTPIERIEYRLEELRDRIVLACRVLRGDDIHRDCE